MAVDSSLKNMHNPFDFYGERINNDEYGAVAGEYTYPDPSERADDDELLEGYFHAGESLDLIDPTPMSLPEDVALARGVVGSSPGNMALPQRVAVESREDAEKRFWLQTTGYDFPFDPRLRDPMRAVPQRRTSHPQKQVANVYSQKLPYASPLATTGQARAQPPPRSLPTHTDVPTVHDLASTYNNQTIGRSLAPLQTTVPRNIVPPMIPQHSFQPPAPSPLNPNRPIPTAPISWRGLPILSLPMGMNVGVPLPDVLRPAVDAIEQLDKISNTGHPERRRLKKPFEGTYEAATADEQLIRDHFAGGSGLLKSDSPLRLWYGDQAVFTPRMWEFLAVQQARKGARLG